MARLVLGSAPASPEEEARAFPPPTSESPQDASRWEGRPQLDRVLARPGHPGVHPDSQANAGHAKVSA